MTSHIYEFSDTIPPLKARLGLPNPCFALLPSATVDALQDRLVRG